MSPGLLALTWLPLDSWIVLNGALCAMSCALLGGFLVLRRMSMMGDAISHAVLPGLALAFLITASRDSAVMLVGAGVVGLLTAFFTEWVRRAGQVEAGAAMGVVFTILFAIGLILIVQAADHVELDAGCVLYGALESTPLDQRTILGITAPRATFLLGAVLLLDLLFVIVLYKELKIASFDPALATTLGINARWVHYALMFMVALTTVAAFESVGSILVIAMLIVPAACAYLLTDRLGAMLVLSVLIGAASAVGGHLLAIVIPTWIGQPQLGMSSAGMISVAAGAIFTLTLFFAPQHGVLMRWLRHGQLSLRITSENLLGLLYRIEESGAWTHSGDARWLRNAIGVGPWIGRLALLGLRRRGQVEYRDQVWQLTPGGRAAAAALVRSHRLWESYLGEHIQAPVDHLHAPAERLEHITDAGLQARLAESVGQPERDPHGAPIPPP